LDERGDAIVWRLTEIAVKAMRAKSRITIVSRSDAEGRWMYQQMREVLAEYRLRGNIVQGQVPKIILIDLIEKSTN
jgi:ABC-type branched-subunit amino acid transport system substrate-binding protein